MKDYWWLFLTILVLSSIIGFFFGGILHESLDPCNSMNLTWCGK